MPRRHCSSEVCPRFRYPPPAGLAALKSLWKTPQSRTPWRPTRTPVHTKRKRNLFARRYYLRAGDSNPIPPKIPRLAVATPFPPQYSSPPSPKPLSLLRFSSPRGLITFAAPGSSPPLHFPRRKTDETFYNHIEPGVDKGPNSTDFQPRETASRPLRGRSVRCAFYYLPPQSHLSPLPGPPQSPAP